MELSKVELTALLVNSYQDIKQIIDILKKETTHNTARSSKIMDDLAALLKEECNQDCNDFSIFSKLELPEEVLNG